MSLLIRSDNWLLIISWEIDFCYMLVYGLCIWKYVYRFYLLFVYILWDILEKLFFCINSL